MISFASISHRIKGSALLGFALCLALCLMSASVANAATRTYGIPSEAADTLTPLVPAQAVNVKYLDISSLHDSIPASFDSISANVILGEDILLPAAKILAEGQRPLRVLHLGDSHVAGKSLPLAVKEVLTDWLGTADSTEAGNSVKFTYIGSNGATSRRFLTGNYMQRIADFRPDLLIISLGTNEAHGMGYREETHTRQLDKFFETLDSVYSDACILLTTPPGDYLATGGKGKQRVKRPNPMVSRCAANIVNYGKEHGMAVWDMNTICGGDVAVRNWITAGLMRPDRVHFIPAGYALQGHLLGNAIVRTLVRLTQK